jgi:hypothetical protein
MGEWLLFNVPTWLLTLLIIGGTVSLSTAAMWLVRPTVQAAMQGHHNEVAGHLALDHNRLTGGHDIAFDWG